MSRRWFFSLVPLVLGLLFALAFSANWLPNPTLFLRADLAALSQICGLAVALTLWVALTFREWASNLRLQARHEVEVESAADRRRFLNRLDHELKNPLTAIRAGLANLDGPPDPVALASVNTQTARLSRLVADLRKLADLETRPIERSPVQMAEILQTLVQLAGEGD